MKYLVTGGAGFIGSHLTEELLRQNHQVTVYDNFSTGKTANLKNLRCKNLTVIKGDICDCKKLFQACKGAGAVFHLAACASVVRSIEDPAGTHASNVTGTLNVFEAVRNSRVKKVVYASSSAVYGAGNASLQNEKDETAFLSFYGAHKHITEIYADLYGSIFDLECVGMRFFNVFGPRQDPKSPYSGVISIFIERFRKGERPVIFGDGKQTRDFVYVQDVVQAMILASRKKGLKKEIFNVGTGQKSSLNEIVKALNRIYKVQMRPVYKPVREGDIRHSLADISKIKKQLGYVPHYTLQSGLDRMLNVRTDDK